MAAGGDHKRRKKSIATYGKAVRRRGPEYLVPGTTFNPSFEDDEKRRSPIRSVTEEILDPASGSQHHHITSRPTPNGSNVFDVPSSDSADDSAQVQQRKRTTKYPKSTRKRAKRDSQAATTTLGTGVGNGKQPLADKSLGAAASPNTRNSRPSREHQLHSIQVQAKAPLPANSSSSNTTPCITHEFMRKVLHSPSTMGNKPRDLPTFRGDRSQAKVRPVELPPVDNNEFTVSPRYQSVSPAPNSSYSSVQLSRRNTPRNYDAEIESSTSGQATPTVLTPKSVKLWNGLLGNDFEIASHVSSDAIVNKTVARHHRAPRKRLIDSLVEQRESKSPAGIIEDTGEEEKVEEEEDDDIDLKHASGVQLAPYMSTADTTRQGSQRALTSAAPSTSQSSGPRITYSRQRSMLAEPEDILLSLDSNSSQYLEETTERRRKRRGSMPPLSQLRSLEEDEHMEDVQSGNGIRTVHELRQAGANKRFMDEIEDVVERIGVPSKQPSMRRSGLLELLSKMHDKSFLRNLVISGMDQRLLLNLGDESDVIAGFLVASVLIFLLHSATSPVATVQLLSQGFTKFISRLLKVNDSIISVARQRKTNMSKAAQAILTEEHNKLLEKELWGEIQPKLLSPQTVALACLELVVQQNRENAAAQSMISTEITSDLFMILEPYSRDGSWHQIETYKPADLHLTLSLLEYHSLSFVSGSEDSKLRDEYIGIIRSITNGLLKTGLDEFMPSRIQFLRLALNITNNNSHASDLLATPIFMRDIFSAIMTAFNFTSTLLPEEERLVSVDCLILMLGVMINLVEWSIRDNAHLFILDDSSLGDALQIFSENVGKASDVCDVLFFLDGMTVLTTIG